MWRIAMALLTLGYPFKSLVLQTALLMAGLCTALAQDNSAVATAPEAALPSSLPSPLALPQSVDWRNEIGTFKIGLVRGWSSDMSRPALSRLEGVFAKALGIPVKVVVFERFTSIMDAQADGRIDLAAYSARAFATARLMCECVDALASPATLAGETGQIAILLADTTKIPSLSVIGSAKIGRITRASIVTNDMLRGTLLIDGKAFTGQEKFWVEYNDYSAALKAYKANDIDGLVVPAPTTFANLYEAGSSQLDLLSAATDGGEARQAKILWRSSYWPYGPIAARSNLATEAKAIVLRTLEQMDVNEPLAHATLSEALAGPFRKTDLTGFGNISASIRLLISQNKK
jgi:phosphonate transport system substrate-binding protein